jgi:hypothetical protein
MMSLANPMKNFLPPAASLTAFSSSNDAPAQNADFPSLQITITVVAGSTAATSTDVARAASNLPGSELLLGCENEIVVTPASVFEATLPASIESWASSTD